MKEEHIKTLKLILILLSILAFMIPIVLSFGSLTEKVDNLEKVLENKEPVYTERVNNLDSRIIELEKIAAGTEVSLTVIQSDIGEIKSDLKEIFKGLKINPEGK